MKLSVTTFRAWSCILSYLRSIQERDEEDGSHLTLLEADKKNAGIVLVFHPYPKINFPYRVQNLPSHYHPGSWLFCLHELSAVFDREASVWSCYRKMSVLQKEIEWITSKLGASRSDPAVPPNASGKGHTMAAIKQRWWYVGGKSPFCISCCCCEERKLIESLFSEEVPRVGEDVAVRFSVLRGLR